MPETPAVQRTQAALQQTQGRTLRTTKYQPDGIVFFFADGSMLEIDIGAEQSQPILMAHFRASEEETAA
jgi:late competence protein required for DNA uptake (superfamily II DNA/RNA helicase)